MRKRDRRTIARMNTGRRDSNPRPWHPYHAEHVGTGHSSYQLRLTPVFVPIIEKEQRNKRPLLNECALVRVIHFAFAISDCLLRFFKCRHSCFCRDGYCIERDCPDFLIFHRSDWKRYARIVQTMRHCCNQSALTLARDDVASTAIIGTSTFFQTTFSFFASIWRYTVLR